MSIWDILLIAACFPSCLWIGKTNCKRRVHDGLSKKWFVKELWVSLLGVLAFAFVYTSYCAYGGDTRNCFRDSFRAIGATAVRSKEYVKMLLRICENRSSEARKRNDQPAEYLIPKPY